MRLDFNIAIVDDDFKKPTSSKCRAVRELVDVIDNHIKGKGFNPKFFQYINKDDCINDTNSLNKEKHYKRIDLFLSDNNLGGEDKDGIDLYLELTKSDLMCDFVLYTRSDIDEIIEKLCNDLQREKKPNLFTRFTFTSRSGSSSDRDWHKPVIKVLDHVISTREEINNLRGIFAQVTAKIHNKMKEILKQDIRFSMAIDECHKRKIIDTNLKKFLKTQRERRNGIIHNDEIYDKDKGAYYIEFKEKWNDRKDKKFYKEDFSKIREYLLSTEQQFFQQISKR